MHVTWWYLRHSELGLRVRLSHTLLEVVNLGAACLHYCGWDPMGIERVVVMLFQWGGVPIGIGMFLSLIILLRINGYRFLIVILPIRIKLNKIMLYFYFLWMLVAFVIIIVDSLLVFNAGLWSLMIAWLVLKANIVLLAVQKDVVGLVWLNGLVHNDRKLLVFVQVL
jgi:hypothetical protein